MAIHSQEASQSYDLVPELWGFQLYRFFTVEMSPENTWFGKPTGNISRKTMELQDQKICLLSACAQTDSTRKPAHKQQIEKHMDCGWKGSTY